MSEYRIETRRRSRSKTPFQRSSEETGGGPAEKKRKAAASNVTTIVEETSEVTSSSVTPVKKFQEQTKQSEENFQQKSKKSSSSAMEGKQTTTETTVITTKRTSSTTSSNLIGASTSTPKNLNSTTNFLHQSFAAQFGDGVGSGSRNLRQQLHQQQQQQQQQGEESIKEVTQNLLNTEAERLQRSTAAAVTAAVLADSSSSKNNQNISNSSNNNTTSSSFKRYFGSAFNKSGSAAEKSYNNADLSEHPAYLEYKRAGEYWNKTPKTDYTYSELSQQRRILAPGVVAMPNMSRKSLETHLRHVNYMVERNPSQEEYIRRRYQSKTTAERLLADSGDELDTGYNSDLYQNVKLSWWRRFITAILTIITTTWTKVTTFGRGGVNTGYNAATRSRSSYSTSSSANKYRAKGRAGYGGYYGEIDRGFFGNLNHSIKNLFSSSSSSVSESNIYRYQNIYGLQKENEKKRRWLLWLLLLLLPLLLLAGGYIYKNPNENLSISYLKQNLTLPQLPDFPKIDLTDYINEENYEAIKAGVNERWERLRDYTDDYLLYIKKIIQN